MCRGRIGGDEGVGAISGIVAVNQASGTGSTKAAGCLERGGEGQKLRNRDRFNPPHDLRLRERRVRDGVPVAISILGFEMVVLEIDLSEQAVASSHLVPAVIHSNPRETKKRGPSLGADPIITIPVLRQTRRLER